MSWDYVFVQVANGAVIGVIYALIAVGVTLIFSILKIVNFAHGDLYMLGGYCAYYLITLLGVPPLAAMFLSMVAGPSSCWIPRMSTRRTRSWRAFRWPRKIFWTTSTSQSVHSFHSACSCPSPRASNKGECPDRDWSGVFAFETKSVADGEWRRGPTH